MSHSESGHDFSSRETASGNSAAAATSLNAAFSTDYSSGRRLILSACDAEPFSPVHRIRLVVFEMAFGHWDEALRLTDDLSSVLPDHPLPTYLRGLVMLRQGEQKRAVNVVKNLIDARTDFIPAHFLHAEAQVTARSKGAVRILEQLPTDPDYAPAWVDLLGKLIINDVRDSVRHAEAWLKKADAEEPPRAATLLQHLIRLRDATSDELTEMLSTQRVDSRAEEVVLLFYQDRLTAMDKLADAVAECRRLFNRYPDRPAVRRLYTAMMTRLATQEAGSANYDLAMRLVEQCLSLEPAETIHYQNLAALFTFQKEPDAYHNAWFELNRHRYRLAALGRAGSRDSLAIAKMHRLFAQQSRLTEDHPELGQRNEGIFRLDSEHQSTEAGPRLVVDSDRIRRDPDQFRSWVYHSQAELTFRHWALGRDPFDFLLQPPDSGSASVRLEALTELAQSLKMLVPDEGELLAESFAGIWRRSRETFFANYDDPPEHRDIADVKRQYVEVIADCLLICYTWRPDGHRTDLVEEFVALIRVTFPFFDESILQTVMSGTDNPVSFSVGLLHHFVTEQLGLAEGEHRPLRPAEREKLVKAMEACIFERTAHALYSDLRETTDAVDKALVFIDKARACNTENAELELSAARFLSHGGYYEEARAALVSFHRFCGPEDQQLIGDAESIQEFLEARKRDGDKGRKRDGFVSPATHPETDSPGVEQLIAELESNAAAIHLYEQLIRLLLSQGRFSDALIWSDRALAKCLSRKGQMRARHVNIEVLGLRELKDMDQSAIELYVKGAHQPALDAVRARGRETERSYALWYVIGRCLLATGRPEEARRAFQSALEKCERRLHRPILSRLAADVDEAYLEFARRAIVDEVTAGNFDTALRQAVAVLHDLQHPEFGLLDLAQVFLRKGFRDLSVAAPLLDVPNVSVAKEWNVELQEALQQPDELSRAEQLAKLSTREHPASTREANAVVGKVQVYRSQAKIASCLAKSAELLKAKNYDQALSALDELGADCKSAHVQQQRCLLLLKTGRFDEAKSIFESSNFGDSESFRAYRQKFPVLLFKAQMDIACRHLQDGDSNSALTVLDSLTPADDNGRLEYAYARAFAFSLTGYAEKRQGKLQSAHDQMSRALSEVEPLVHLARDAGHTRLLQLYEKLDTDLSVLERQLP